MSDGLCYKIAVYVPECNFDDYVNAIQDHIPKAGDEYDRCLWYCLGVEQFRPLSGVKPVYGETYETVRKPSVKIEIYIPRNRDICMQFIRNVLIPYHPWETPVIQLSETEFVGDIKLT